MTAALLFAMLAQAGLTLALYPLLTWARRRAVQRGANAYAAYELTDGEDRFAGRVSANLRNQFELPLLFFVGALLLIQLNAAGLWAAAFAWVFVVGRAAHAAVQITTGNVMLRGLVFAVNFLGVVGLWALIAAAALPLAGLG